MYAPPHQRECEARIGVRASGYVHSQTICQCQGVRAWTWIIQGVRTKGTVWSQLKSADHDRGATSVAQCVPGHLDTVRTLVCPIRRCALPRPGRILSPPHSIVSRTLLCNQKPCADHGTSVQSVRPRVCTTMGGGRPRLGVDHRQRVSHKRDAYHTSSTSHITLVVEPNHG
jgi:hypothetical protein